MCFTNFTLVQVGFFSIWFDFRFGFWIVDFCFLPGVKHCVTRVLESALWIKMIMFFYVLLECFQVNACYIQAVTTTCMHFEYTTTKTVWLVDHVTPICVLWDLVNLYNSTLYNLHPLIFCINTHKYQTDNFLTLSSGIVLFFIWWTLKGFHKPQRPTIVVFYRWKVTKIKWINTHHSSHSSQYTFSFKKNVSVIVNLTYTIILYF